jgi:hypothetical protein
MSDESPKPKRKRWRWIIAGVLLFVIGSAGWWNWPRGDARLVGSWAIAKASRRSPDKHEKTGTTVLFAGNGIATVSQKSTSGHLRCLWRLEGNTILLGGTPPVGPASMWGRLFGWYSKSKDDHWLTATTAWNIVSESNDQIRVSFPPGSLTFGGEFLERIRE